MKGYDSAESCPECGWSITLEGPVMVAAHRGGILRSEITAVRGLLSGALERLDVLEATLEKLNDVDEGGSRA